MMNGEEVFSIVSQVLVFYIEYQCSTGSYKCLFI